MTRLLDRAGVPSYTLHLIPSIVETCRCCRMWTRPLPQSVASVDMVDKFNQQVECDLLFVYKHIIFHLICRCTRWYAAALVPDKSADSFMAALHTTWVSIHGPMRELIMDGETAVAEAFSSSFLLARLGIKLVVRAPNQHARIIERRGALTRDCIHRIDAQLDHEGLTNIPMTYRLAEAVFCSNALVSVNNMSPYNAVYGRVPHLLPDINQPNENEAPSDSSAVPHPGLIRHSQRLREIAVQAMVEGTARARLGRALQTRSLPAGQAAKYELGQLVDYYRKPNSKDISGWIGPATIIDITDLSRGTIGVKFQNNKMNCRLGDVRRHLHFLCLMAAPNSAADLPRPMWTVLRTIVEQAVEGQPLHIGWSLVTQQGQPAWKCTDSTKQYSKELHHLKEFAYRGLQLDDCVAVRAGRGLSHLPALHGHTSSLMLWWLSGCKDEIHYYEYDCSGSMNLRHFMPEQWKNLRIVQFLCTNPTAPHTESLTRAIAANEEHDSVEAAQSGERSPAEPRQHAARPGGRSNADARTNPAEPQGRLSPIPEEHSEADESQPNDPTDEFFIQEDPDLQNALHEANYACLTESVIEETPLEGRYTADLHAEHRDSDLQEFEQSPDVVPNYHVMAANQRAGLPVQDGCSDTYDYVEVHYSGDASKLVHNRPAEPKDWEVVVVKMYLTGARQAIIQRDDDVLTAEELRVHSKEVAAAMLKELQTWAKLKCFSRKSRVTAKNIIDCRWVFKWKWEVATTAAEASSSSEPARRRVIRARLTVRGFKDRQAQELDSYAGTSQRYSQRIVCSEAVRRQWPICTTDISKAFLQGVTYEELSELTGEPVREVNFYLPPQCVPLLREVPGFEDFNERTEVLHCDKPGTGLTDAPRAFSIKLAMVTKSQCKMMPSNVDGEMVIMFENGDLLCVMAKHVDDLKITGRKDVVDWVLSKIQAVFGELKILWHNFTNCGLRHIQDRSTFTITLDQEEYINNLKAIAHPDLKGQPKEQACSPELTQLFMSLLGAVAYALMTRIDVAVFVCALQRVTSKPQIIHIKRLNAVLRWMQSNPRRLCFPAVAGASHLRCVGDAAFKKEEDDGRSLRGALFLRTFEAPSRHASGGGSSHAETAAQAPASSGRFRAEATSDTRDTRAKAHAAYGSPGKIHILDAICKSQRHVTRSTFSSELLSACDTADHGMLIALMLHELNCGIRSIAECRTLRETGGWSVKICLYVDALSVFAAVTATFLKIPAEKSLLSHVQYLRELLDTKVIEAILWIDTRDMIADGLTKGAVDRAALHETMAGTWTIQHAVKCWTAILKLAPRHQIP